MPEASQQVGTGTGRTGAESVVWRTGGVKDGQEVGWYFAIPALRNSGPARHGQARADYLSLDKSAGRQRSELQRGPVDRDTVAG